MAITAGPLLIQEDPGVARRRKMAEALVQQGSSTAPVHSVWEGLGRVLQGAIGGYKGNQIDTEEKDRQKRANDTMARALSEASRPSVDLVSSPGGSEAVPAISPYQKMAQLLADNPDTAPMAMQYQAQDMDYQQKQADRTADLAYKNQVRQEDREWQKQTRAEDMAFKRQQMDAELALKRGRILSPEEAEKYGFGKGAVVQMDASGNASVLQKPSDLPSSGANGLFDGKSVDGQALNYLIAQGKLSPEEAAIYASGKTVTGPNGELQFLTPDKMFNQQAQPGSGQSASGALTTLREGSGPKFTQDQTNSATFAERMMHAEPDALKYGNALQSIPQNLLSKIPLVGNNFVSPEYQLAKRAVTDFATADLRKESGSSISPTEFQGEHEKYFPQPGDSPETISRKAEARKIAIEGMKRSAGPALNRQSTNSPLNNNGPIQIQSPDDYSRLPSGAEYMAPDGQIRRKK